MRRPALALAAAAQLLATVPAAAQPAVETLIGRTIVDVRLDEEGRTVIDPLTVGLLETHSGEPLSMGRVRDTLDHLFGLGRYRDIRVLASPLRDGVRIIYELLPVHAVRRVEFTGELGVSESELRQAMVERFGALPPATRVPDIQRTLRDALGDRGYRAAQIVPRVDVQHAPERAIVTFHVTAGPRTTIGRVEVEHATPAERAEILDRAGLEPGRPYDRKAIDARLSAWTDVMRSRGYYETQVTESADIPPGQAPADVRVDVRRGPHVTVTFAGDPIAPAVRDQLVPVRREGSVDEDLLEDVQQNIREHLQQQGYRDATVEYVRQQAGDEMTITFTVHRGPRFTVAVVELSGDSEVPLEELKPLLRVKAGDPFVQAAVDAEAASVLEAYRSRGFAAAAVQPSVAIVPAATDPGARAVAVRLLIREGHRTIIDTVRFEGHATVSEAALRAVTTSAAGRPFYENQVATDRDNLQLLYLNRGYQSAHVDLVPAFSPDRSAVAVTFAITEGPLVRVDHVLIVGNTRTSSSTISRELLLRPGHPLGYADLLESQRRLSALGLFRRVRITELRHGSDPDRDVLVSVEEAPPTTVGWGGGLEGGTRLRPDQAGGAVERFELAPRGFFEVGRRNLWGKNRSANLYSRVSLRARDPSTADIRSGAPAQGPYGFNEYRIVGTFREPRVFGSGADAILTGSLEQAVRSSFNFARRIARAEVARRLTSRLSVSGLYQFSRVRLFDEHFAPGDELLIDRLFPQVRLSTFSATLVRDTRDDPLDPDRGMLETIEGDLAGRRVGSEVGFAKATFQGFAFHRLRTRRRVVLALGARLGLASGFSRQVLRADANGDQVRDASGRAVFATVADLPASERFFAGGDTTVRGFALDRLGTPPTISASGFPTGGNGLMIFNAEIRTTLFGPIGAVLFFDAGNVYLKASDMRFGDMRKAGGFGVRYKSPVGPIRLDVGFKLDRRETSPGNRERLAVVHISLGQAF